MVNGVSCLEALLGAILAGTSLLYGSAFPASAAGG